MLEAGRRQLGVADRVVDVVVAETGLQDAGIEAASAARNRRHAAACADAQGNRAGRLPEAGDQLPKPRRREPAPRSEVNTNGDPGLCSRLRRRRARGSRPRNE